jgi:hypothetical protein
MPLFQFPLVTVKWQVSCKQHSGKLPLLSLVGVFIASDL